MSVKVLVPLAEGFEEIEAVTVIDVLRRAGAEVTVAGLREGAVKGSRGVVVVPDVTLDAQDVEAFDAIVLPGGMPGATNLAADPRLGAMLRAAASGGSQTIGAICAAPAVVLQGLDLLGGRRATCYPSFSKELPTYEDRRVVVDGKVITSQGPGTAMEFALELVRQLMGEDEARAVAAPMLHRE